MFFSGYILFTFTKFKETAGFHRNPPSADIIVRQDDIIGTSLYHLP